MKKMILMAFIGAFALSSCNRTEDLSPANADVSTSAKESLTSSFPNAKVSAWEIVAPDVAMAEFTVNKNDMVATFANSNGRLIEAGDAITAVDLPAIATDYLKLTYPGYTLVNAGEKKDKAGVVTGYMANIDVAGVKYHIHFDATGKFVDAKEKTGKSKGKGTPVLQADLLPAIKTYLTATYPGYVFKDAISMSKNDVIVGYGVRITTADAKSMNILFDTAGVFVKSREGNVGPNGEGHKGKGDKGGPNKGNDGKVETAIAATDLPAAATTYLETTYKGYTLKTAESIAINGVLTGYEANITLSDKNYEVYFDAKGVFVKVKTK
jgi:hypothetical protein